MALILRHRALRVGAILWWLLSAVLLAWTLLRPELGGGERSALTGLVPLYLAGLPLTHLGLRAVNRLSVELYLANEFVPSVMAEGVWIWAALSIAGWLQWFVLLPLLVRLVRGLVERTR